MVLRFFYINHLSERVARVRNTVIPTTSWNAVSKGPTVIAGSKPSRLESRGVVVPTNAEILIEINIEIPTTSPNIALPNQKAPMNPIMSPQIEPIIKLIWSERFTGSAHLLKVMPPVASARTVIAEA